MVEILLQHFPTQRQLFMITALLIIVYTYIVV